jgi:hypothetical protein
MTSLPYSRSRRTAFIRSGRAGGLAGELAWPSRSRSALGQRTAMPQGAGSPELGISRHRPHAGSCATATDNHRCAQAGASKTNQMREFGAVAFAAAMQRRALTTLVERTSPVARVMPSRTQPRCSLLCEALPLPALHFKPHNRQALLPQTMIIVLLAGSGAAGEVRTRFP